MLTISLSNVPNQRFEFVYGESVYNIRLRTFRDILYADVEINNEQVLSSTRCVTNGWMIPYKAYTHGRGNFKFECTDDNYPNFANFGKSCFLRFYPANELEQNV